jgi:hypothetical protein
MAVVAGASKFTYSTTIGATKVLFNCKLTIENQKANFAFGKTTKRN